MHDFTPLFQIVTVGCQLNDGTHVHANSPFADRKLSWKAAILFRQCTAGKGGLMDRGASTNCKGFLSHSNRDLLVKASCRPESFKRRQHGYLPTAQKRVAFLSRK